MSPLSLLVLLLLTPAHTVGLSRGLYVVDGADIDIELAFARPELLRLAPSVDVDGDGTIKEGELAAADAVIATAVKRGLQVARGEVSCTLAVEKASLVEEDGVVVAARAHCDVGAAPVVVNFAFVDSFGAGHRHLGTVTTGSGSHDVVALAGGSEFTLADSGATPPVTAYLLLGIEHILLGFDHLVFLLGLLIVLLRGGGWTSLFSVVTAFTLAHSITLGLAATGTLVPPSTLIEILIAASIVFVGIESFFAKSVVGRWKITLPFGLVHGFGFAGALSEIGLPRDQALPALALFNVGVEAGQLACVAVVAPLLLLLRRKLTAVACNRIVAGVATVVVVAGGYWLVERIVSA